MSTLAVPITQKPLDSENTGANVLGHTCHLSIWGMEAEDQLHSKCEASLGYMRPPHLKQSKTTNTRTPCVPPILNRLNSYRGQTQARVIKGFFCSFPDALNLESLATSQLSLPEVTSASQCLSCQDPMTFCRNSYPVHGKYWLEITSG